jgi:hypothetical protein
VSDDYAKATAAASFIEIGDVTYRVGKFGPRDIGDLEAWLKSQVPDPRLAAKDLCAGLPDAVAKEVWTDLSMEAANWPPSVDSRQGQKLLTQTWDGNAMLLWVSLRRHNASFSLEDAKRLTKTDDEIAIKVMLLAFPEATFDPKSQAATGPGPG